MAAADAMPSTTPLQHSSKRQFRAYNVLIVVIMALGSIEYGYNASIISTTLAQPSFISYFRLDTRSNATQLIATTNGLYQAGGFLGVWTVSYLSDKFGRRNAIAVSAFVNLVAAIGLTASVNISMFIVFRFISGWGAFMIVTAVPIWMNEVTPPSCRGVLVDCHNVGFLIGYTLATVFGYGFYHLPNDNNWGWRGPMIFQALWVVILLPNLLWMPESPRWLVSLPHCKKTVLSLPSFQSMRRECHKLTAIHR